MTVSAHKLVHSEPFLDYKCELWQLLSALYATCGKIYGCTLVGPKLLLWNFIQIFQLSIRSGAQKTFPSIFGLFAIFDRHFAKIVAPSNDKNKNFLARLKGKSLPKNGWYSIKIDP